MPFYSYLPEEMGTAILASPGPFVAGSYAELTVVYTAGTFGIDDTGNDQDFLADYLGYRQAGELPQPAGPNYATVEAINGATLDYSFERLNIRPWVNTLLVQFGRGLLQAGETLIARLGDRRFGSPGIRLQTNCEERFELKPTSMRLRPMSSLNSPPHRALRSSPAQPRASKPSCLR